MTVESDLLRLLEPAVRPDGIAGGNRAPVQPLEQQRFDQLLEEAKSMMQPGSGPIVETADVKEVSEPAAGEKAGHPMDQLAQISRIENDSLRMLVGQAGKK